MLFLPKMPKHRDISAFKKGPSYRVNSHIQISTFRKVLKAMSHKGLSGIKKDITAKDAYILALKRLCISKGAHCVVAAQIQPSVFHHKADTHQA